jgi:hypothetical protein
MRERIPERQVHRGGVPIMEIRDLPVTDDFLSRAFRGKVEKSNRAEFVRGPIPIMWLKRAADVSQGTAYLATIVWHLTRMRKSPVRFSRSTCERYGLKRTSVIRQLRELERAGLVTLEFRGHEAVRVTLVTEQRATPATVQ